MNYFLQFILIKLTYKFFYLLPLEKATKISGFIFKHIGNKTKINKIALNNCKIVFPNLKNYEIKRIIDNSWQNLGSNFVELSRLEEIVNKKSLINIKGIENIKEFINNQKQGIFFSIHQSNWEICVPILDKLEVSIAAVYRHINNIYLDKLVYKFRTNSLTTNKSFYTPKGIKSAKEIIENVKNKKSIFLLIDQKDSSGENIVFFNKKVRTQLGFLKIARKYQIPIIPIKNKRIDNGKIELTFLEPFYHNDVNISDNQMMETIHCKIEEWIKSEPSQWFWQHKRFS